MNRLQRRKIQDSLFRSFVFLAILFSLVTLLVLLITIMKDAISIVDFHFIFGRIVSTPEETGVFPAILGTLFLAVIVAFVAIPVGIGSAIYIEEYLDRKSKMYKIIDLSIANLSGVPSIIYGILGATVFIGVLRGTAIAGGVTLSLLILPVVIVSSQEALKGVPNSLKQGAYGLGMTKWQVIKGITLPYASPGMITGIILAISRAMGEAAPLIVVGIASHVTFNPQRITDDITALPLLINKFTADPSPAGIQVAAGVSFVLLFLVIVLNSVATYIRIKFSKNR